MVSLELLRASCVIRSSGGLRARESIGDGFAASTASG